MFIDPYEFDTQIVRFSMLFGSGSYMLSVHMVFVFEEYISAV